jgi:hypothetical protein
MERVKGIEPSSSAWKAVALPLSYTRFSEIGSRKSVVGYDFRMGAFQNFISLPIFYFRLPVSDVPTGWWGK